VALTTGDCGPITIVSIGLKVILADDNLIVLADIIDPVFGPQQLARCQKRMANSNRLSLPPLIAATASVVAVASSNKMPSPPKNERKKKSKPSAGTPPSKNKRKNKEATTPTDKTSLDRIMKKAKKTHSNIKPGREEKIERDARQKVADNCKNDKLEVRNDMWPWLSDMTWDKSENKIKLIRNQVNHNTVSPSLSNEIANNYLGNIAGADLDCKIHDPSMGGDMKCILTYNPKGENNDGPNDDVGPMKFCSSSHTTIGYGSIRPPTDESYDPSWGDKVLRHDNSDGKKCFRDYCKTNSCTDEGLQDIASYNGFEEQWKKVTQTFTEETSMVVKRFESIKVYAQHRTKRKYHLDPMEGGHRKAAVFQANFCAQLNPEDGSIKNCLTYTPADFRKANLIPDKKITVENIIGKYCSMIEEGSVDNGFFSGVSTIDVIYLSDKDIPVTEFLKACRICSEGIGREKRNSATKDVFVEIAKATDRFLNSMGDNELTNNPCLDRIVYTSGHKFPKSIKSTELPEDLNWQNDRDAIQAAIPLPDLLYSDSFQTYCKAPFKKDVCERFMNELQFPPMSDQASNVDVSLKPPFVVAYESMAVDAGKGSNQRATTEMVNKWCLLPKIIHLLMAHKSSTSIVETAKSAEVAGLVLYAMRHHVHNQGFSNIQGHACMPMYGQSHVQCLATVASGPGQVILAALYLVEMVNASLTTIQDNEESLSNKSHGDLLVLRREKLVKETAETSLLFSTMTIYANNPGIDRMIRELGKIYIL